MDIRDLIKLMIESGFGESTVQLPANISPAVIFVPQNERRVGLVITGTGSLGITLHAGPAPANTNGIIVTAGSAPLVLSLWLHGGIVKGPIYATTASNVAGSLTYWESLANFP